MCTQLREISIIPLFTPALFYTCEVRPLRIEAIVTIGFCCGDGFFAVSAVVSD